jgi:hypothetical protein
MKTVSLIGVLVAALTAWADDSKTKGQEGLDPKVVGIVKQVGELYQKTKSLRVEATVATTTQDGDEKREFNITGTFVLVKPNQFAFRSQHVNDKNAGLEMICNGKTLYTHAKRLKQYTETTAPAELAGIGRSMLSFGHIPTGMLFQNLLAEDAADALLNGVTACSYAGTEKVGDSKAHHLKFKQAGFDWELWVAVDGKPLVMKMTSARDTDTGKSVTVETYQNWQLDVTPDKADFAFTAPADAKKVKTINPRPQKKDG